MTGPSDGPSRSTELGDLTWPVVAGAGEDADGPGPRVLAVPLGSTEQHGPHLPLSTDTDIAVALVRGLAGRRDDVLVAPALAYGSSGEHDGFAGTLSIGHEALELVVVELVRSATATFPHVLLVNGHGGNVPALATAVSRLRAEHRDVLVWSPRWRGDAHAGWTETSVQLALDAGRVGAAREAGAAGPLAELMPVLRRDGLRAVTPNGVLGDPAGASAEEGAALLAEALDDLDATVTAWLELTSA